MFIRKAVKKYINKEEKYRKGQQNREVISYINRPGVSPRDSCFYPPTTPLLQVDGSHPKMALRWWYSILFTVHCMHPHSYWLQIKSKSNRFTGVFGYGRHVAEAVEGLSSFGIISLGISSGSIRQPQAKSIFISLAPWGNELCGQTDN